MDLFSQAAKAGVLVGILAALVVLGIDVEHKTVVMDMLPQLAAVSEPLENIHIPLGDGLFWDLMWKLNEGRLMLDAAVVKVGVVWVDIVDEFMLTLF